MDNLATRIMPGYGFFVQLNTNDDFTQFEVTVDGQIVYSGSDGQKATDAYLHTMADPETDPTTRELVKVA